MRNYFKRVKAEPGFAVAVGLIFVIGVLLRCYIPFAKGALLIHDGGLHLVLAEELVANSFVPPRFTSYNFLSIPFVYPPLSTYLTAGPHGAFGIPIEATLRNLPTVLASFVLGATFSFFRELTLSRLEYLAAILLISTLSYSFIRLVKSGGTSQALGAFFAILAMKISSRWLIHANS